MEENSEILVPSSSNQGDVIEGNCLLSGYEVSASDSTTWKDLKFKEESEVFDFYEHFAKMRGFSVRIRYTKFRKRNGVLDSFPSYLYYECHKEGVKRKVKSDSSKTKHCRQNTRIECKAYLKANFVASIGQYEIKEWLDEHSHILLGPQHVKMLPKYRKIEDGEGLIIQNSIDVGISIRSTYEMMSKAVGGRQNLNFLKVDLKNYINSKRQLNMEKGEATVLMNWLSEQCISRPGFFYKIQVDTEEDLTSIFWADSTMISDYSLFGDFISFDTTYRTNDECRPLAVFVGLNHHYTTCVFGAALLFDETASTFKWLFESFLECMKGKHPLTIITDQAPAIAAAVDIVFPDTFHALCAFHIRENARRHLGPVIIDKFLDEFYQMVGYVDDEVQFEYSWKRMLLKCFNGKPPAKLMTWLDFLYSCKEKWSSAWVKNHFTAGKTTTQLSEQFNANSRNYLNRKHSLSFFFTRFQALVDDLRYNEHMKEFKMLNTFPSNKFDKTPLILHAAKVYTPKIFKIFHDEFDIGKVYSCRQRIDLKVGSVHAFDVIRNEIMFDPTSPIIDEERVLIDYDSLRLSCTCRFTSSWSILCRHILRTMDVLVGFGHVFCCKIPEPYINKRWCKDCKSGAPIAVSRSNLTPASSYGDRYQHLFNVLVGIGTKICVNEEAYTHFLKKVLVAAEESNAILKSSAQTTQPARSQHSTFAVDSSFEVPVCKKIKKKTDVLQSDFRLKSNAEIRHLKRKNRRKKSLKLQDDVESPSEGEILPSDVEMLY